jgi:hypothetical protein
MQWGDSFGGSSGGSELRGCGLVERKSHALRYNRRVVADRPGCWRVVHSIQKTQLNSAQIRGFLYVDSRNADAPGHDYQAQQ